MKNQPIKRPLQKARRISTKLLRFMATGDIYGIARCYYTACSSLKIAALIIASIFLSTTLCIAAPPPGSISAPMPDPKLWAHYKQLYISAEGRVIDTGNQNISHSEGQGTGMLLANAYHDHATFQKLWGWTQKNLQIRKDKLFAWRWQPARTPAVTDLNNASDGDILIAWALYRAAQQWNNAAYRHAAQQISRDIRTKLIRRTAYGWILLPGAAGFEKNNGIVVNLSYWIFPAFNDFTKFDPAPEWGQLTQSGLKLVKAARFGQWNLPPDWLLLGREPQQVKEREPQNGKEREPQHGKDKKLSLPPQFAPQFGYNAIRIPLYLAWAKHHEKDLMMPFINFWTSFTHGARGIAATANLLNNTVGLYEASPGFKAIIQLIYTSHGITTPVTVEEYSPQDYYSASLLLLARLAKTETNF